MPDMTKGLALLTALLLAGCNTFEGAGEDIESAGEEIEEAAE
ncbi:MAG: hypothetical protein Tsb0016_19640 [Sphingomonadales bacterium]